MNIPMLFIDALSILVYSHEFNCVFGYFHEMAIVLVTIVESKYIRVRNKGFPCCQKLHFPHSSLSTVSKCYLRKIQCETKKFVWLRRIQWPRGFFSIIIQWNCSDSRFNTASQRNCDIYFTSSVISKMIFHLFVTKNGDSCNAKQNLKD